MPPRMHSMARRAAVDGWRGARLYWGLAERLVPLPPSLDVPVGDASVRVSRDDWIGRKAYRGMYERAECAIIRASLPRGGVAVDVGANVGYLTAIMADAVGSSGRVFAFEPAPSTARMLVFNMSRNGFSQVVVREVALGDGPGSGALTPGAEGNSGLASLRPGHGLSVEEVQVRTLDDELEASSAPAIDLLKVDVEGWESSVVKGAFETLESGRVRNLLVEITPEFGSTTWAGELVARLGRSHEAYAIGESGTFRRRPSLTRVSPQDVTDRRTQFNLFLTPSLADLAL